MKLMDKIMKVGNLTIYKAHGSGFADGILNDGPTLTLCAYNGADCIMQETYIQVTNEMDALDSFMLKLDYCTYPYIIRALNGRVTAEYEGRLLSGMVSPLLGPDYFLRVDPDSRYYKHYTLRPTLWPKQDPVTT